MGREASMSGYESFKKHPGQGELRPILPVVFYQGRAAGTIRPNLPISFDESHQSDDFLPRFCPFFD
jgi:hypothetical protein